MVDEELRDVLIDSHHQSNRSDSSEDDDRIEMKWSSKQEEYIEQLRTTCEEKSKLYDVASHKCKKKYNFYSLPTIIIPLVLSVVNPYVEQKYEIVNSVGMAMVSILTGLNTFYNYGKKCERYNEYSSKYSDIVEDIHLEMNKPKRFRVACDLFLERIKTKKGQCDATAPFV